VVKELVENSLDAGATHLEIKLVNGGMTSVTVRDDGCGIPAEEVPLLLERHTTSKIEDEADLGAIRTLGFRGEALYSVAAASDVILSTRFRDEEAGTRLTWENGQKTVETISWPGGTQVESLRLFHSTPARRKFLRSSSAEYAQAAQLVSSYALAYPNIAWRLVHDGRETMRTPGTGNLDDAVIAVYGVEIARKMLPVSFEEGSIRVTGAISAIDTTRARRTDQIIFLNGRLVRDPGISAALERPYQQFLPRDRHPLAILKIECNPEDVDVNVHPHKREVRLAQPRAITGSVFHAVSHTIRESRPFPTAVEEAFEIDQTTGEVTRIDETVPRPQEERATDRRDELDWAVREPKRRHTPEWPPSPDSAEQTARPPQYAERQEEAVHQYPSFEEMDIEDDLPPVGHAIQFANTYLIYNQGRAVYLIDQHNLHERILFEEFMGREEKATAASQTLLFPLQVTLSPALAGLVAGNLDELHSLGFEIEEFSEGVGRQSFVLRAVPQALGEGDPVAAFTDIMERSAQDMEGSAPGGFRRAFAVNLACKSAIKAGQPLSESEIRFLIEHVKDGTYVTCPHGRPTMIRLDEDWFRKAFKRSL